MTLRTANELAQYLSCAIEGDAAVRLRGVAGPERAGEEDLIYLDSPRHVDRVQRSAARCVITSPSLPVTGKTVLLTAQPKLAFARAAARLAPPPIAQGVHRTA